MKKLMRTLIKIYNNKKTSKIHKLKMKKNRKKIFRKNNNKMMIIWKKSKWTIKMLNKRKKLMKRRRRKKSIKSWKKKISTLLLKMLMWTRLINLQDCPNPMIFWLVLCQCAHLTQPFKLISTRLRSSREHLREVELWNLSRDYS